MKGADRKMQYTQNAKMKLPEYTDVIDVQDLNGNFETVDAHLGKQSASEEGAHGLRYNATEEILEVLNRETGAWEEAAAAGGVQMCVSATEPTDQDAGDFWLEQLG